MKKNLRLLFILPFFIFCFQNKIFSQCWNNGDLTSYDQSAWGDQTTSAGTNLNANYNSVYASSLGIVEVGIPGSSGFSMRFSAASAVLDYLVALGTPAALDADQLDPTSSSSGQFGGNVLALQLNVDFSDAGHLAGNSGLKFGDLVLYNFSTLTDLNGMTVRQFLQMVNNLLGGGTSTYTISQLDPITSSINQAFSGGSPSTFAQQHLRKGWKSGDYITHWMLGWHNSPGSTTVTNNFTSVYGGASLFIGGTTGSSGGYFLSFTGGAAVINYLPSTGAAGPLTGNMENPITTASGSFGGDVLSLQLDVDVSDANVLTNSSGVKFGDLVFYNLSTYEGADVSGLNGMTIRQLLTAANVLLGGSNSGVFTLTDIALYLDHFIQDITGAFEGGTPTAFAQLHLKRGWQIGDLKTYVQSEWTTNTSPNITALLEENFNTVYASTFGVLRVGGNFIMDFDNAAAIEAYLPQTGTVGQLDATLNDPTFSNSGKFGGEVVTMKLNVDFSDAGLFTNNSGLKFGDLTICGFTTEGDKLVGALTQSQVNALNGKTVRQLLNEMNIVLGAGTGTLGLTVTQLYWLAFELNASFIDGYPNGDFGYTSTFTQLHLVNGSCDCGNTVTNHCPTASSITISTTVGSAVKFLLQGSDADNNTLTYSISQAPSHGTATIVGGDSISYTPTSGYHGSDQLKYKVSDGQCDAEGTVDITVIVCPQGSGYWKNNPNVWPVTSLLLGTVSYTQSQLITIFNTAVGTGNNADASLILAKQLIAAKLSIAAGATAVNHVADSIAAADALIGSNHIPMKVKPNTPLGNKMTSLASFLESFNNGAMSTGCVAVPAVTSAKQNNAVNEIADLPLTDKLEVKAFPNPSSGNFTFFVRSKNEKERIVLQVFDQLGRSIEIRSNIISGSIVQLGDKYIPGAYYIRVLQGKEHKEIKLIKIAH